MAVYGNRAYEDALVEMQDVCTEMGFRVIAAFGADARDKLGGVRHLVYDRVRGDLLYGTGARLAGVPFMDLHADGARDAGASAAGTS